MLPATGEIEIVRGSTFAVESRKVRSIKTVGPNLWSSIDFALWKRRLEDFALSNGFMCADVYYSDWNASRRSLGEIMIFSALRIK